MRLNKRWAGAVLLLCIMGAMLQRAAAQNSGIVRYKVEPLTNKIPGDSIMIRMMLDVQPGWYIYAPSDMNASLDAQMMQLKMDKIPEGISKRGSLVLPPATLHAGYDVFQGSDHLFLQQFIIAPTVKPGLYEIVAELRYQACNDRVCYPPVTEKIIIPVTVKQQHL